MKRAIIGGLVAIAMLFCSPVEAREYKGFVVGAGVGLAPLVSKDVPGTWSDDSQPGYAFQFMVGGVLSKRNMFVLEGNFAGNSNGAARGGTVQGFGGPAWYHYFKPSVASAFSTVGLGACLYGGTGTSDDQPRLALLFGGGYRFARSLQAGAYMFIGTTSIDSSHLNLSFLLSAMLF